MDVYVGKTDRKTYDAVVRCQTEYTLAELKEAIRRHGSARLQRADRTWPEYVDKHDVLAESAEEAWQMLENFWRGRAARYRQLMNRAETMADMTIGYRVRCLNPVAPFVPDPDALEELDLSVRAWNCLTRHGIRKISELLCSTPRQVLGIHNLGLQTLVEIRDALHARGLELASDKTQADDA